MSDNKMFVGSDIEDLACGQVAAKSVEQRVFNFLQECLGYGLWMNILKDMLKQRCCHYGQTEKHILVISKFQGSLYYTWRQIENRVAQSTVSLWLNHFKSSF